MACSTTQLTGNVGETLALTFTWADSFTGLTSVFHVGDKNDFSETTTANLTITGDATIATADLLLDMAKGCYKTQLILTSDDDGSKTIVEGPELVVKPTIA